MLAKLGKTCLNSTLFLADYLAPQVAKVIVGGSSSKPFTLQDMVFQGTVLGPSLWNVFFEDVHAAAELSGGKEAKFADDLNIFKEYSRDVSNADIIDDLRTCQHDVHEWGKANRVSFDPAKEEFCILDPLHGEGASFRLLGPVFDCKLSMTTAVNKLVRKARPKCRKLLATRRFYSVPEIIVQFKTHVLNILESCVGAIYHATDTTLQPLDNVRDSFVRHLGLDSRSAYLEFNLAPTKLRRDIAMLGFLHKVSLGDAHKDILCLFPPSPPSQEHGFNTRTSAHRHNKQLLDRISGDELGIQGDSIFGFLVSTTFCHNFR